jgi:hypothetical protein
MSPLRMSDPRHAVRRVRVRKPPDALYADGTCRHPYSAMETHTMLNRFPAQCASCGLKVLPGEGNATKPGAKWVTTHVECPRDRAELQAAEAYEYRDEDNADAFTRHAIGTAWTESVEVRVEGSAFYDTTVYRVVLPDGVSASHLRSVLAKGDGQKMASYGSFGGYSTIGNAVDQGDGTALVESVYHVGD